MQNTTKKPDRLGQLISQFSETQNAAAGTKLFANKSELEAAEKRIKVLEQENAALKSRPLAISPKATTAPATNPTAQPVAPASTASTYEWQPAPKPVLSRAKFNALSPADKSQFVKDGGKISN